jgi:hypothetical protein
MEALFHLGPGGQSLEDRTKADDSTPAGLEAGRLQ